MKPRALRRLIKTGIVLFVLLLAGLLLYMLARDRPQDLPWTALDLGERPGMFTGRKIAALREDFPECQRLMTRAGIRYQTLAPVEVRDQPQCGYSDGLRLVSGGSLSIDYLPKDLGTSCPVAAGLAVWEWNVVQPAARRHFGRQVAVIEHYGSYNCRRIVGRGEGVWSQHATANAIDIAAFRMDDATRITVKGDWNSRDPQVQAFLREVRDGACGLFATVLSPDYNEAHHDHFHFDQADRGAMGWRACR